MRGQSDGYWWPKHQRVDARNLAREFADEVEEAALEREQARLENARIDDEDARWDPCSSCGHGE